MLTRRSATTVALCSLVLAMPAFAVNPMTHNAAVSLSCVAEDTTDGGKEKLVTVKGNNREIIAWCNSLDPYDSADDQAISDLVGTQAVVIDADYTLRVIDRCSLETICQVELMDAEYCSNATNESQSSSSTNGICMVEPGTLVRLPETTILEFNGSLRCKGMYSQKTGKNGTQTDFQTGCHGYPSIGFSQYEETLPCTMNVSTGSAFQSPKSCEVPR